MFKVDTETQMLDRFRNFCETLRKSKLKAAPVETYFFPAAVKFLGHVITKNRIRPLVSKNELIQQTKRPESREDVMKILGSLKYYSN